MSGLGAAIRVSDAPERQTWRTPAPLFDALHARFRFDVDAAADDSNHLLSRYWTVRENGIARLADPANAGLRAFVNPPYDDIYPWTQVALYRARRDPGITVLLLPARTDQRWFHDHALVGEVYFSRGRVQFVPPPGVKPSSNSGGSVLVVLDPASLNHGVVGSFDAKTGALL